MSRVSQIMIERRCSYSEAKRIAEQEAKGSFAAPVGSATLTLATLAAVKAQLPQPPPWQYCTVKPQHAEMLRREIPPAQPGQWPIVGIEIHEKHGQVADSWMFSDCTTLRRYLAGELSELDLVGLIETGACRSKFVTQPNYQNTMKEIYRGKLTNWSNGEDDEILSIEGADCPLAETIKYHMYTHGKYLTVRYWTSFKEMSEDELTEATVMMQCGAGKADYGVAYSEITGYLWTTEELEVGGHDLLKELKSHIGKWLHLEIEYGRAPAGLVYPTASVAGTENMSEQSTTEGS